VKEEVHEAWVNWPRPLGEIWKHQHFKEWRTLGINLVASSLITSHPSKYKHHKSQYNACSQELPIISVTMKVVLRGSGSYNADF
jgi:hypothetical protein